jgi:hypothetical protein
MCCKFVKWTTVVITVKSNKSSVKSRTYRLFVALPSKHATIYSKTHETGSATITSSSSRWWKTAQEVMSVDATAHTDNNSISLWLYSPFDGPWPIFQFLNPYAVGRTPWTGDQPDARPLLTHRTTQTKNKRTQTFMLWMKFEPTISTFERAKTVHALERAATLIGW